MLKFLRGCKFSLERTKEKLDFYYACRSSLSSWFTDWDVDSPLFQRMLKTGFFLPLGYDRHGRQVILLRSGVLDPSTVDMEDIIKTNITFIEFISENNDQAQIQGIVLINDLSGTTARHALLFSPVVMKKALTLFQEAFPSRPKVSKSSLQFQTLNFQ